MSFNKVILIGRLTADPEFSQSASGVSFCRFSIAVDRGYAKNGQEKQTDFFRVSTFRQTAEFVSRYFTKGKLILVEGKVQNDNYTDQNGVKHYSCNIVADNVSFVGSKSDDNMNGNGYQPNGFQPNGYQPNNNGYAPNYNYQPNNYGYQPNNNGYQPNNNGGFQQDNGYQPNNNGNFQQDNGYQPNNNNGSFQQDNNNFQQNPQNMSSPQEVQPDHFESGSLSDFEEILSDGEVPF